MGAAGADLCGSVLVVRSDPAERPHHYKHEKLTAPVRAVRLVARLSACALLAWFDPKQLPVTGSSFKLAPGRVFITTKRDISSTNHQSD